MKWLKRTAVAVAVIILLLAVVPFFISLDDYIPRIEAAVSAKLKEPVKIGGLRAAGLPLPHVTLSGISVGKADDIKIGKVTVTPDLWSLLGATKIIRSVSIEQLVLTRNALDRIPAWVQADMEEGAPREPPAVRLESIQLDDAVIRLRQATFGPFDARVRLTRAGQPESAAIATRDGRLKADIRPQGTAAYLIDAVAKDWKLPIGPPLHFNELIVKGVATLDDANFSEIRGRLYGGTISGKVGAGWKKGMRVKGEAGISQVEIRAVLQALGKPPTLSGRLTARPVVFSANASEAGELANALRLETPFEVQNGVLHGLDIRKAATSLISREGGKGGETRFDRLTGRLVVDRGTRRITQINAVSGALAADGHVTISPRKELSGRVNTNIKTGSIAAASMPLNVSGTVESPLLYPTKGTMAGAAVGTAILGPGVGTAVGSKVGQWTEGLFGKGDESK